MADSKLSVVPLNEFDDPSLAHRGLDTLLGECQNPAVSSLVIVYEAGMKPRMKYYGRTLSSTELRGVLMTILLEVG